MASLIQEKIGNLYKYRPNIRIGVYLMYLDVFKAIATSQ